MIFCNAHDTFESYLCLKVFMQMTEKILYCAAKQLINQLLKHHTLAAS